MEDTENAPSEQPDGRVTDVREYVAPSCVDVMAVPTLVVLKLPPSGVSSTKRMVAPSAQLAHSMDGSCTPSSQTLPVGQLALSSRRSAGADSGMV